MPRRSWDPTVFERMEQRMLALGLRRAEPATRVSAREGLFRWREAQAARVNFPTLNWDRANEIRQEVPSAYRELCFRASNQPGVIVGEAFGFGQDTTVRIPPPEQPAAPKEPHMHTPTPEQTLITCLQQGVATLIGHIQQLSAYKEAMGPLTFSPTTRLLGYADHIQNYGHLTVNHPHEVHYRDQYTPLVTSDNYSKRKVLSTTALIWRHVAVVNALEQFGLDVAPLRQRQINDYEEHFAERPTTFVCPSVVPSEDFSSHYHLPQLSASASHLYMGCATSPHHVAFTASTPLWRVREACRLKSAVYTPLPEQVAALLPPEVMGTQFPHLASKPGNAGRIAFTQSPTAGALDRQQVIKPGRFLRQHLPDASDEEIKQLAAACLGALSAGIHHSKDGDDFARVYIHGPSSCMAYDETGKYFGRLYVNGEFFHPARVYAHPENDIEIVWIEVADRIAARAVVNTKRKRYPCIYSNDSVAGAGRRLRSYLEGLGYEQADDALDGQKLLRVAPDNYSGAIICPYIDSGNRGVEVDEGYLTVGGDYEADHETGCLHDYNTDQAEYDWYCDNCGDGCYSDDGGGSETNDFDCVCDTCLRRDYTHAFHADRGYYVYINDNETLYQDLSPLGSRDKVYMSDGEGDYHYLHDDHYPEAVAHCNHTTETEDGEWILTRDVSDLGYFLDDNDIACLRDNYAVLDGELVERSEVPDDAQVLTAADPTYPQLPAYQTVAADESEQEDAA
jgi:hypothetical protein